MTLLNSRKQPTYTAILIFLCIVIYCLFYYRLFVYYTRNKKLKDANTSPIYLVDVEDCPVEMIEIELPVAKTIEFPCTIRI